MRTSTSSYIVELPLRVNDQQNRFLEKAFEFGRTLYNATLGTGERQKFCVHGIIGARQTGASNEHEHQTQFS